MTKILVADDDPMACKILVRMLSPEYEVATFEDGQSALNYFVNNGAEVIITDIKMPRMDGFELLNRAKEVDPEVIVFIVTGFSTVDSAVAAIKNGAYDYIPKPFDPDDVMIRIERALKEQKLEERVRFCEGGGAPFENPYSVISEHPAMLGVMDIARRVARTDSSVLIQGETGVGKELIARMIHRLSSRKKNAFVPVNCSALADGIMESELFGHEKGAFTGAVKRRMGFFEIADKGSILLDEIGTTDDRFQVKLLRVLQDKLIYRVGGDSAVKVDVRVLSSTNKDLEAAIGEDSFRSDLYYRLSIVTIHVPSLRERREDIPILADHFLRKFRMINPRVKALAPGSLPVLEGYDYPGNVRELANIIERAMILEDSEFLTPSSLLMQPGQTGVLFRQLEKKRGHHEDLSIRFAEEELISRVLEMCQGKKVAAAEILGINKTTLWRKMKKYGLSDSLE
jgi:DNA-binding NtrC family response regulator